MKIRLLIVALALVGSSFGATVFVSQSGGSVSCGADGTQTTVSVATFNSSQVAGNTYKLCGTITSRVTPNTSGSAGNIITILFESGATIAPADCTVNACINLTGLSWYLIDFSSDGKIQPTANGNNLANNVASRGIILTGANQIEIKGTPGGTGGIYDIYQYTCCVSNTPGTTEGIFFDNANNINVHHLTFQNMEMAEFGIFEPAGATNWNFSNNSTVNTRAAAWWGDGSGGSTLSGTNTIHDNDAPAGCHPATPLGSWCQLNTGGFHLEQFHIFAVNASNSSISGFQFYNNWVHGNMSSYPNGTGGCASSFGCSDSTAMLFIEAQHCSGSPCVSGQIFNNLFQIEQGQVSDGLLVFQSNSNDGTSSVATYNNTIDCKTNTGVCYPVQFGGGVRNMTFQNNIVENGLLLVYGSAGGDTFTSINNDLDFNEGSFGWAWNGGGFLASFAAWQLACSCDGASLHTNPLLNSDYTPTSSSPVRAAGTNKTSLGITALNSTKPTTVGPAGSSGAVARPAGGGWDIGAYQFGAQTQASAPSFTSPGSCPFTGTPTTVAISDPNAGTHVVCYRLDGVTPATNGAGTNCAVGSTLYTGSFSAVSSETVIAIAGTSTLTDSATATCALTITQPASPGLSGGGKLSTGAIIR